MIAPLNGWIRFPRALAAEARYSELSPVARALYLHLVMLANFTATTTRRGLTLKPGQVVTSWRTLADAMSYVENRRRITPTVWKARHTAGLLRTADLASWTTAPSTAGGGLVITLTRWELHAEQAATTADTAADTAAHPLRELPQHREKETYPPAGATTEPPHRRALNDFLRRSRESLQELHDVRAREREGVVN